MNNIAAPYSSQDHEFSSAVRFLDEFDRHFSHRHRFIHTWIPRFDLEEYSKNYILFGEVPGLHIKDLSITATDAHNLEITGKTLREVIEEGKKTTAKQDSNGDNSKDIDHMSVSEEAILPEIGVAESKQSETKSSQVVPVKRLISERLVGDFHRSFSFAKPIETSKIVATICDGVLKVVVPKGPVMEEKTIPITRIGSIAYAGW